MLIIVENRQSPKSLFSERARYHQMDNLNLIVKFMLVGDSHLHVKGATRIKVDGRGGLLLYDAQGGAVETIELGALRSIRVQQMRQSCVDTAALAVA
jgi:hypothetical protein